jgi:DNA-directed RNA polymerase I, II, and III subunit RPABC2
MPGSDDELYDDSSIEEDASSVDESEEDLEEEEADEQEPEDEEQGKKKIKDEDESDENSEEDGDQSEDDDSLTDLNNSSTTHVITGGSIEDHDEDEDDEEINDDAYLQKFNADINRQYLMDFHPEAVIHNYDEISALSSVVRDENNNIIDNLHQTLPYLTKYERARVLGQRAKQINAGAKAFVKVHENIIDGYLIADLELSQKRIPFIIRRPIPGGACEYWKLKDLEIIGF